MTEESNERLIQSNKCKIILWKIIQSNPIENRKKCPIEEGVL